MRITKTSEEQTPSPTMLIGLTVAAALAAGLSLSTSCSIVSHASHLQDVPYYRSNGFGRAPEVTEDEEHTAADTGEGGGGGGDDDDDDVHRSRVEFLQFGKVSGDYGYVETYSGMWWQKTENVLALNCSKLVNREKMSFLAFETAGWSNSRLPVDWLDFSVEHLSNYYKFFQLERPHDAIPYRSILQRLERYIYNVKHFDLDSDGTAEAAAPLNTIALLPFTAGSGEKSENMKGYALAATLASLSQIGISRALVVGGLSSRDEVLAGIAFDTVRTGVENNAMELAFAEVSEGAAAVMGQNLPRGVMMDFQRAVRGEMTDGETAAWLGTIDGVARQWKYVYFTEPDLILNTRPTAMASLTAELDKGCVLAAHRLQPLPHEVNFPGYDNPQKTLPAAGNFSVFHDLDPWSGVPDACCDAGKYWPGRENKCNDLWWRCGFSQKAGVNYSDVNDVLRAHRQKLAYPMIRIRTGFGVPFVGQHARMCIPKRGGTCRITSSSTTTEQISDRKRR